MTSILKYKSFLGEIALKSNIKHKHGCMAFKNGKVISPSFHNYNRTKLFGKKFSSAHSEMCVVNYLLSTLLKGKHLSYIL
jgi:hypothetical protein